MDPIESIPKSLTVFVCGVAGLIPVIGFLPAAYALIAGARLLHKLRNEWNPAATYLSWGVLLGLFSLGITILAGLIFALQLVPPFNYD